MTVAILLVTCCLERSRSEVLSQVIANIQEQAPELSQTLTVFDNASTEIGTTDVLRDCFDNVYQADHNVGYWSAIDWWLDHLSDDPPTYTYIIESDMIHYGLPLLGQCADFLDKHPELGSMRLHEYSVENLRFFNKDAPIIGSRRNLWQSHTNKVTGQHVVHDLIEGQFWKTNFLTQLPALNRYTTMKWCFEQLKVHERFTELDFQRFYHIKHRDISILNGGIFHCDLNPYGVPGVTGSWTDPKELQRIGYQSTRFAAITPRDQYTVRRV